MKWYEHKIKSQYFHLLQFMHEPCHPASQPSCGKLERKRDARKNWIARNIAMESEIKDWRSARHIVYYRFKHMHRYQRPCILSNIEKFNTVYPENQWFDLSQYPAFSIHTHIKTGHGLSLNFCQNEKWTWNWIIWLGSIAKWKIHLCLKEKKRCCIDYNRCAGQYQRNDMNTFFTSYYHRQMN